jgi:uncharacterized protein (DUF302 family)
MVSSMLSPGAVKYHFSKIFVILPQDSRAWTSSINGSPAERKLTGRVRQPNFHQSFRETNMMKSLLGALSLFVLWQTSPFAEEMIKLPDNCEVLELEMIKCPLAEDVGIDDAIDSMKLRANMLNFKLVAHMPLSEQVKAMGGESARMEIYQFCDASIAAKMVSANLAFAGYLPCRIALVEDNEGNSWLITLNMDSTMGKAKLPDELKPLAMKVRNNIYNIMRAGALGEL